jgi:hypothetical protein
MHALRRIVGMIVTLISLTNAHHGILAASYAGAQVDDPYNQPHAQGTHRTCSE